MDEPINHQHPDQPLKIYIIFYSCFMHVYKLALAEKQGVDSVPGCRAFLFQVPETLSPEALAEIGAPPKPNIPIIESWELPQADAFLWGFPTRSIDFATYGMMCAQFKAFLDSTGHLWKAGGLQGKPVGMFTSTASAGGGQETTIMTALTQAVHHGMVFVPPGYTFGPPMFDLSEVRGGSPWGAGTFTGPTGTRQPSEEELAYAVHQGAYTAKKVMLLAADSMRAS